MLRTEPGRSPDQHWNRSHLLWVYSMFHSYSIHLSLCEKRCSFNVNMNPYTVLRETSVWPVKRLFGHQRVVVRWTHLGSSLSVSVVFWGRASWAEITSSCKHVTLDPVYSQSHTGPCLHIEQSVNMKRCRTLQTVLKVRIRSEEVLIWLNPVCTLNIWSDQV